MHKIDIIIYSSIILHVHGPIQVVKCHFYTINPFRIVHFSLVLFRYMPRHKAF